jgi:ABC-type lipoprotein release transport system permease subunit
MRQALADGMSISDAPLLIGVLAGVALSTAIAAYIPARRALSIPPALAMRG